MTILNTSKLTFFKNEGKPLTSGYIYVGVAGQDPLVEANQKTVTFTDSAGTEATATQPLRTDGDGRIQWNGKAITASVEGSYSLLILDSNQVQINGGWTPTVTPDTGSSTDSEEVYGLTLADVKELEVAPGDVVRSIGKLVVTDNLGAEWLVVSATGNPADDVDLIDFENGTQGQRIKNFTGEAVTEDDKQAVRDNIDVYNKSEALSSADEAVETANIQDGAVTLDKLRFSSIENAPSAVPIAAGASAKLSVPNGGDPTFGHGVYIFTDPLGSTEASAAQHALCNVIVSGGAAFVANNTGVTLYFYFSAYSAE